MLRYVNVFSFQLDITMVRDDEFLTRNRIRYIEKAGFNEDVTKDDSKASAIIVEEKKEEVKQAVKPAVVAPKKVKKGKK